MNKNISSKDITQGAIIGAIYIVLVLTTMPISFGPVQFRIAETLTILPYFTPAAIPGLAIGCLISGFLTGATIIDIIFGSLATLIAAFISYKVRWNKFFVPIPPIVVNALVIPWVLRFSYGEAQPIILMMLSIALSQFIVCFIFGMTLWYSLDKIKNYIFI